MLHICYATHWQKQKSNIVADKDLNGGLDNTLQTCRDGWMVLGEEQSKFLIKLKTRQWISSSIFARAGFTFPHILLLTAVEPLAIKIQIHPCSACKGRIQSWFLNFHIIWPYSKSEQTFDTERHNWPPTERFSHNIDHFNYNDRQNDINTTTTITTGAAVVSPKSTPSQIPSHKVHCKKSESKFCHQKKYENSQYPIYAVDLYWIYDFSYRD